MGWLDETYKSTTKKANSYLDPIKKKVGASTGTIKKSTKWQIDQIKKSPGKALLDPQHGTRAATELTEKTLTGDTKLTHQFGKAFGGKSASDRAAGAMYGAGATWQTGNPYIIAAAAAAGGMTGREAINKGLSGQPVVGKTGGGGPTGKGKSPIDPAVIKAMQTTGSTPGLSATPPAAFQAYDPTGISVDPIEALKAKAVADMNSPDPIVAAQAAKVLGIDPSTLPQVQAQMTQIGGPSQFLQGQQDLVKTLQGRVAGTAGPSLAELQMKKAQQDMINQMAAQAGSISGRALPAAQRQLMQAQQQSGQQLAMDAGILRAQEQQQAEAQLAGALGQYRGQDIERTGLQLESDVSNQAALLEAQGMNQETALAVARANLTKETDLSIANLDAETQALIANQNMDLETKKANLLKDTSLSEAELTAALKIAEANQATALGVAKYDETQKLEAARLAEATRIADEGTRLDEATIAQREADSIRTSLTNLAVGKMKGTQAQEARDDKYRKDLTGELMKGAAQVGAEWYNSDSGGEEFNVDDELLKQAISEGY